jgi:hypothetical protein
MNDRNPNNKGLEASVEQRRRGVLESQAVGALRSALCVALWGSALWVKGRKLPHFASQVPSFSTRIAIE